MDRNESEAHRRGLHQILASDRLIKQGKTLEQVNQYLRETPDDTVRAENLAYLEQDKSS
jgi:hypothetical protein